jgi:hypothetical protein
MEQNQIRPNGTAEIISTNTVRHIRCGVFSTTPEIPPETSSSDDAFPAP